MRTKKKPKPDATNLPADAAARTDATPEMSAEDAALIAQLSPEGQAALGMEAAVEVAADDAEMAAEGDAGAAATDEALGLGAEESDAKPIAAVLAAIAKIEERLTALEGNGAAATPKTDAPAPAADASTPNPAAKKTPTMTTPKTDSLLTSPEAVIAAAQAAAVKTFNDSATFVGVVRKDGHAANTTDEAAGVMLTVIKEHLPALSTMAEDFIKTGRTDSLAALYGQAETIRRDSLITSQADALAEAFTAPTAPGDGVFRAPTSAPAKN